MTNTAYIDSYFNKELPATELAGFEQKIISDPDFAGTPKLSADDFRLIPGANVITDVHWTGLYAFSNTPLADNFTIQPST